MPETNHLKHIDSAKGILIIIVVIGHMLQMPNCPHNYIYVLICSFHMPAFFMISGALFNSEKWHQKGLGAFLKSRFQSLMIPWFFFETQASIFILIFKLLQQQNAQLTPHVIADIFIPIIKNANPLQIWTNCGANWFLITLFLGEIIMFAISKLKTEKLIFTTVSLTVFLKLIGSLLARMPYGSWIGRTMLSVVFLAIGYLSKKFIRNPPVASTILCFPLLLITANYNGRADMSSFSINHLIFFIASGILGTVFVVGISALLHTKLMCVIGHESLIIMGTHQLIKYCIISLWPEFWIFSRTNAVIFLVSVCFFECLYIPLINKTFPGLVGKRPL